MLFLAYNCIPHHSNINTCSPLHICGWSSLNESWTRLIQDLWSWIPCPIDFKKGNLWNAYYSKAFVLDECEVHSYVLPFFPCLFILFLTKPQGHLGLYGKSHCHVSLPVCEWVKEYYNLTSILWHSNIHRLDFTTHFPSLSSGYVTSIVRLNARDATISHAWFIK